MIKKVVVFIFLSLSYIFANAQNVEGYENMLAETYQYTVKQVQPVELNYVLESNDNIVILDTRESEECQVGKIEKAICVGYDNFDMQSVKDIPKDKTIYVYCSIGYRSERIGEMLQQSGYKRVFNLYGGIFNWANSGYELVDEAGNDTKNVHGFDKNWSKWLNKEKCIIELD